MEHQKTTNELKQSQSNGASPVALNVGIVGAGIAGLAAASALIRIGHKVEVSKVDSLYERSKFSGEVGAAINIGPNAAPVLKGLGFDYERARALNVFGSVLHEFDTLKETYRGDLTNFEKDYGVPWKFLHRVDFHNELKRLALNPLDGWSSAQLHVNSPVVDVDCEEGLLTFADGSTVRKDLIIGADGVHSIVANRILGSDVASTSTGECVFRFVIPTEKLRQNPITRPMYEEEPVTIHIAVAPDRRFVWYPCRGGELQNFVGMHPAKAGREEVEDWQAAGSIDDLLDVFHGFNPAIVETCRNAEDLKLWKLKLRPPVRTWTRGKAIIIGDAVHPMLPHQGQGGNQSIEDAGALGILLSDLTSIDQLTGRLDLIQNTRRDRASVMQILSNAGQDQSHKVEKDAQPYIQGPVPSKSSPSLA
ncbi:hypothetical protein MMC13_001270 [Lambiella insularis]|nr:hypothetical protein [Lambiella insularis]